MKKIKKAIRFLLITCGWTALYLWLARLLMAYFWHFELFEPKYWKIINRFWQNGGVINSASEYMFLLTIAAIIPLWYFGLRKAYRLSYIKVIFFPFFWYHDYINRKYADAPEHRVVLKNLGGKSKKQSSQQMLEADIAARMPQPTQKKDLNSSKIRSIFEQKNRNFQKKMGGDNQ